jgi:GT2 family glycosyltransferase
VVPVKDNQVGIDRLVESFMALPNNCRPYELLIVDNGSLKRTHAWAPRLRVLDCQTRGPAAARNVGWRASQTTWVLFVDSDCILCADTFLGYSRDANGALGYAGLVEPFDRGLWADYYHSQKILIPPPTTERRPAYLVTANALVLREALVRINGFDESFHNAGGEDIDLALRLGQLGELSYAPHSRVMHEFGDGARVFLSRFARYGRGSHRIEQVHDLDMWPRPFVPANPTAANCALSLLQTAAMMWGYLEAKW